MDRKRTGALQACRGRAFVACRAVEEVVGCRVGRGSHNDDRVCRTVLSPRVDGGGCELSLSRSRWTTANTSQWRQVLARTFLCPSLSCHLSYAASMWSEEGVCTRRRGLTHTPDSCAPIRGSSWVCPCASSPACWGREPDGLLAEPASEVPRLVARSLAEPVRERAEVREGGLELPASEAPRNERQKRHGKRQKRQESERRSCCSGCGQRGRC